MQLTMVMHNFSLKLASIVLSFVVVLGTVGLTLNVHHCRTSGSENKSILPVATACETEQATGECCEEETAAQDTSCCKTEHPKKTSDHCCSDFRYYFKLVTDFNLTQIKVVFNNFLHAIIRVIQFIRPVITEKEQVSFLPDLQPPPLLAGKEMVIAYHQLKSHLL